LFGLTLGNRGHQKSKNKSYKVVHWPSMGHKGGVTQYRHSGK
jgi:hypothetical protein